MTSVKFALSGLRVFQELFGQTTSAFLDPCQLLTICWPERRFRLFRKRQQGREVQPVSAGEGGQYLSLANSLQSV